MGRIGLDGRVSDETVRLRPVTREEFEAWLPRQLAAYAELIAASGAMPAQAARRQAEQDTGRYFSRGFATPGHFVFRIMAGGVPVGWLWLQRAIILVFGENEYALRAVPLISGVAALVCLYVLTRRVLGVWAATVAR